MFDVASKNIEITHIHLFSLVQSIASTLNTERWRIQISQQLFFIQEVPSVWFVFLYCSFMSTWFVFRDHFMFKLELSFFCWMGLPIHKVVDFRFHGDKLGKNGYFEEIVKKKFWKIMAYILLINESFLFNLSFWILNYTTFLLSQSMQFPWHALLFVVLSKSR